MSVFQPVFNVSHLPVKPSISPLKNKMTRRGRETERAGEKGRGGGRKSNNCSGGLYPHWVTTGRLVTSAVSISALTPTPHTHAHTHKHKHTHIDR